MTEGALRGIGRSLALGMGAAGFAACAWASDAAGDIAVAQLDPQLVAAKDEPLARLEMSATALPRLDGNDASFAAPRLDMALMPARRSSLGVALGVSGVHAPPAHAPALLAAAQPAVDVGVTMRHTFDNNQRVDVTAWRRMTPQQPDAMTLIHRREPGYGARVEWSLSKKGARSRTSFKDLLGVQLEGGGRISLRRKHGGPMIYYRNQF